MNEPAADIWFGPGGLRGVFGAGVAEGLQDLWESGRLSPTGLRLFGSSIGCLNAVFLATGNTRCGLAIFQEDTRALLRFDHLWPAIVARARNRAGRWVGRRPALVPIPPVLDIDHVLAVMRRRVPGIERQICDSPLEVHGEVFDLQRRAFRHVDLRRAEDAVEVIRCSLACAPFYSNPANPFWLDSGVRGPGCVELLREREARRLVVVLNAHPTRRLLRYLAGDLLAAALAASPRLSACYLGKQWRMRRAIRLLQQHASRVLLVFPGAELEPGRGTSLAAVHDEGRRAAEVIGRFLRREARPEASAGQGGAGRQIVL